MKKTDAAMNNKALILILITGLSLLMFACGGSSDPATPTQAAISPTATTVPATATSVPEPTATPEPSPTAIPTAAPVEAPSSGDDELLAQGKVIFEKTGGGVGCAFCHGLDGKGNGPSGVGAPANRGATKDRLEWALDGGETDAMTFIKLSSKEKDAVLVYLAFLATQP